MLDLFRGSVARQHMEILFSFLPVQYSLFTSPLRHSYRQTVHSRAQPLHALPVRPASVSPALTLHCGGIPLWVNLIPTFRLCHALFILSVSLIVINLHLCTFISPSVRTNLILSLPPLFLPHAKRGSLSGKFSFLSLHVTRNSAQNTHISE